MYFGAMVEQPLRQNNAPEENRLLSCVSSVSCQFSSRALAVAAGCSGMRGSVFSAKQAGDQNKEKRDKDQVDEGGREQSAGNGGADGVLGCGAGPLGQRQRQGAEEEGQ